MKRKSLNDARTAIVREGHRYIDEWMTRNRLLANVERDVLVALHHACLQRSVGIIGPAATADWLRWIADEIEADPDPFRRIEAPPTPDPTPRNNVTRAGGGCRK